MKIFEDIYGNTAIVYHRTRVEDLINRVYTEGWKPKDGSMYGRGFYATYTLEAQLNTWMRGTYGNIIVKFAVHGLENFFFFDYEEFKKSPNYKLLGKPLIYDFLQKQFERFNIDYKSHGFDVDKALQTIRQRGISSEIALWCVRRIPNFRNLVDGIVFTGEHDGKILVCYRMHENLVPISFTMDEGFTWTKVPTNKEHLKKLLLGQATLRKQNIKKVPFDPIDFGIKKFKFNNDGTLDVYETVDLSGRNLTELPFTFNIVDGSFICSFNNLKNLRGCPKEINGSFDCSFNEINTLEFLPEKVLDVINLSHNKISSVTKLPVFTGQFNVKGHIEHNLINLEYNKIEYIDPKALKNITNNLLNFVLNRNNLKNLDFLPERIYSLTCRSNENLKYIREKSEPLEYCYELFNISECDLRSLYGAPRVVEKNFDVSYNKNLFSLEYAPEKIGGNFYFSSTKVSSKTIKIEHLPKEVGGYLIFLDTPLYKELNITGYGSYTIVEFVKDLKRMQSYEIL